MTSIRNYTLVTAAYWSFTLTDGALRMLVILHFHQLGYTALQIAFLFLFYEFFGIVTNLVGGWLGSKTGLKITLFGGLAIQIVALAMLAFVNPAWPVVLSVAYVMVAQALSGIAKDLTKMSSKSAIKLVVPEGKESTLFKWVSILTGSKNALKGVGFFLGGVLLAWLGFENALFAMAAGLTLVLAVSLALLPGDMGKSKAKVKFRGIFSMSREINVLSVARFFLFGARDVWFVVGLPVFLADTLKWNFEKVGAYLALWVIGYGIIQSLAPRLIRRSHHQPPQGHTAQFWTFALAVITGLIAISLQTNWNSSATIVVGLAIFGIVFAINSAVHSYLILAYSDGDKVALNVGFYYMANAGGRLIGTVFSGLMFQWHGLPGCLWASVAFALVAGIASLLLPRTSAFQAPQSVKGAM